MNFSESFKKEVFRIRDRFDFSTAALELFHYQAENNAIYKEYLWQLKINPRKISNILEIPFLPIDFFKTHKIISGKEKPEQLFTSSGTAGSVTSKHFISDISVYEESFRKGFNFFYGDVKQYCILALLPSYLERKGSSLVYMVNDLITRSAHPESGFYLNNIEDLVEKLKELENSNPNQKIILLGVTYALLDLAEKHNINFRNTIVMETGGMKGKKKEMVREELHTFLCNSFGVENIHSEYGMTELLSQAYSKGNGIFHCPPWMQVQTRDTNDPFSEPLFGKVGGINIIDLANINSCAFIATQDIGRCHPDISFEVLGRFDNSDLRGCNLMVNNF